MAAHDLKPDLGPLSDAVTEGIRVEVLSRHLPENSRPQQGVWVFQYTVRITNQGSRTVQLLNRHWIITDALERVREVKGAGVVGQQPVLAPGESFKYSSWCPLETPTGFMRGIYEMATADGERFNVEIAPFALKAPYTVH
jgi:ApaG protein